MAKLTLNNITNLQNESSVVSTINANNDAIEAAMNNTLFRDNTAPNEMDGALDMNSNRILNLPAPISVTEPLRLADVSLVSLTNVTNTVTTSVNTVPGGRVTLTTGVPVTSSDVAGATRVYYTACMGGYTPVYNGTTWVAIDTSTEKFFDMSNNSGHTNYHQSGRNFDVFVTYLGVLGTGPSWNAGAVVGSDTQRGTGAGSTELQMLNGILVNKNTMTLRYGSTSGETVSVPAFQATYVATLRTTADGVTEDSSTKRFVSNGYNFALRHWIRQDTTDSWSYSTQSWRQANGSTANQIEWVHGLDGRLVDVDVLGTVTNSTSTARNIAVGIGIDVSNANSAQRVSKANVSNTNTAQTQAWYTGYPGLGYHKATWIELGAGTDTQTWYGDAGFGINGAVPTQSAICGRTWN